MGKRCAMLSNESPCFAKPPPEKLDRKEKISPRILEDRRGLDIHPRGEEKKTDKYEQRLKYNHRTTLKTIFEGHPLVEGREARSGMGVAVFCKGRAERKKEGETEIS